MLQTTQTTQTILADIDRDLLAALDALDMVTGWCTPQLRVWDEQVI
ncbi:hypothetical protein CLU93_4372 [Janthinobacterium sp. 35]|nr:MULTISPECIES: hypothetical protein [unclassified Janthinobacterium]PIG30040.1 hypothetical protein CLU93_4372 [Janthinobacterium sp. 35]PVX37136.1 hypothetical protein C8C92_3767 [Janthinobacterium sp. 78]